MTVFCLKSKDGVESHLPLLAIPGVSGHEGQETLKLEERIIQLFDELRTPLSRHLLSLGMNQGDTEEIVQETFLRLFEHLHKNGREDNLRGWVFKVGRNLAIDRRRSVKPFEQLEQEDGISECDPRHPPQPSPEELLLDRERTVRLERAVRMLTEQERECFHLRAEGFRYREIGEILGIGTTTVADLLRRVVQVLARELQ